MKYLKNLWIQPYNYSIRLMGIFFTVKEYIGYLGVIAQLVERLNGIQKVGGSIPPDSTTYLQPSHGFYNFLKAFLFCFLSQI